jgi:hypothetical protein
MNIYQQDSEQLLKYLADKTEAVKVNDFLKSLYPPPTKLEPVQFLSQGANARFRTLLTRLSEEGKITVQAHAHLHLGMAFFPTEDQRTHYHTILDTPIFVQKK